MALKPEKRNSTLSKTSNNRTGDNLHDGGDDQKTRKNASGTSGKAIIREASNKQLSSSSENRSEVTDLKIDDSNLNLDELEKKLGSVANDLYKNARILEGSEQTSGSGTGKSGDKAMNQTKETLSASDNMEEFTVDLMSETGHVQAANDDPENLLPDPSLIYNLQGKSPSPTSRVCIALGFAWFVGCIYYGYVNLNSDILNINSIADLFASSRLVLLMIITILPIFLLWAYASMIRSAQEMQGITRSVAKSAIHLLHPESSAIQSVSSLSQVIRREVAAIDNSIERAVARASELEHMVQNEITNLERSYTDSEVKLHGLINELSGERENIEEHAEKLHESIANAHSGLTKELDTAGTHIQNIVSQAGNQITQSINESSSSISRSFLEMEKNLEEKISSVEDEAQERLLASGEAFNEALTEKTGEFINHIKSAGDAMSNMLGMHSEQIRTKNDDAIEKIEDAIVSRSTKFTKCIEKTGADATATIASQAAEFENLFSDHIDGAILRLNNKTSELRNAAGKIETDTARCVQNLSDHALTWAEKLSETFNKSQVQIMQTIQSGHELAVGKLDQKLDQTAMELDSKAEQLSGLLSERTDRINKSMGNNLAESQRALEEKTVVFKNILDDRSVKMSDTLEKYSQKLIQQTGDIEAELSERYIDLSTIINEKTVPALESVKQYGGQITQSLTTAQNTFRENTARFEDFLDNRSVKISDMLEKHSRKLSQQTGAIGHELSERSTEFSNVIVEKTIPVLKSIYQSRDEIIQNLDNTSIKLDAKTADIVEKLSASSQSLHTLLDQAEKKMNIAQSSLTQQLSSMTEIFNRASTDLDTSGKWAENLQTKMKETVTGLLSDMDSTARQLSTQSNYLVEAAKQVDTSQDQFSKTLNARHEVLDKLSNGLLHRSDEIETSMSALAMTVNSMFEEINSKSKEFGGIIETKISTAINDTSTRFRDATESMKDAAKEVSAQLEKTRGQMRRGILELPEETRQSADSMRRVVTDQIRALKDLSDIVASSGKTQGTMGSLQKSHVNVASPSYRQDIAQTIDNYPLQPPLRNPEGKKQKKAKKTSIGQSLQKEENSDSWVSSLLKRASENEISSTASLPALPQKVMETFNKLSTNIVQVIDPEESVKLWERYQRGEKNIFVRYLRDIQDKKAFGSIQLEYKDNQNFRNMVNQYIMDFEDLLSDIVQRDPDSIQGKTCLNSDIGRIYIMLGHILHRFKS